MFKLLRYLMRSKDEVDQDVGKIFLFCFACQEGEGLEDVGGGLSDPDYALDIEMQKIHIAILLYNFTFMLL